MYGNTTSHGHKVRAIAAKALGILATDLYDTSPGKIHFSGGPYDTDESTIMMSGEVMEGYAGSRAFASTAEESQGMKLLSASADKHGRKPNERIGGYIASWCNVYATAYAVDKVVKKSGWGAVNGTTVRDEFLKFRDLDIMGLARWEFTPDKPEGKYGGIYQVKGGKLLPITGWVTCPDLKPAKYRK